MSSDGPTPYSTTLHGPQIRTESSHSVPLTRIVKEHGVLACTICGPPGAASLPRLEAPRDYIIPSLPPSLSAHLLSPLAS
eukprot:4293419-Pyramimonas_sp.AAC.1